MDAPEIQLDNPVFLDFRLPEIRKRPDTVSSEQAAGSIKFFGRNHQLMKNAIMLVSGHIAGVWEFKKSAAFIILSVKPVSKRKPDIP